MLDFNVIMAIFAVVFFGVLWRSLAKVRRIKREEAERNALFRAQMAEEFGANTESD